MASLISSSDAVDNASSSQVGVSASVPSSVTSVPLAVTSAAGTGPASSDIDVA